jgi:signal peptidase I
MTNISDEILVAAVELLGRAGQRGTVRVQGQSMLPTLQSGDLLAVDFDRARLRRGGLLLYRQMEYLVVHRLLSHTTSKEGRPSLRTRGDGLSQFDPFLDPENVIGRVLATSADGKRWRDECSALARLYGYAAAAHALSWGYVGITAGFADRAVRKLCRIKTPFRAVIARVDLGSMTCAHVLFFKLCHPIIDNPVQSEDGGIPTA